jgi:hypothetical protein
VGWGSDRVPHVEGDDVLHRRVDAGRAAEAAEYALSYRI